MHTPLPPTDFTNVASWKKYFENDLADEIAYNAVEKVRADVESLEDWKATKRKASEELQSIPNAILGKLLDRFLPFIAALPTGHGPGHLSRDLIHLSVILHDPYIQKQHPVEIFVGIIAGIFHDIGNAVIERYDEPNRFAGHAEVGAYLFGQLTQDILPGNVCKLIQFAMSSHTNYLNDLEIKKYSGTPEEKTMVRKHYANNPLVEKKETHKIALWMTQATDRADAVGLPFITRHILTKSMPTRDYSHGEFHVIGDSEEEDFMHQFMPIVRTPQYRQQLINKKDKTSIVLEHFYTYYETAIDISPYSRYDTPHFLSRVITTNALDSARFIIATTAKAATMTSLERQQSFERFYRLCEIIEPAYNTGKDILRLKRKFQLLSESYQNHWANGFTLLTTIVYPRWYQETKELLKNMPKLEDKKLTGIITDLHKRAERIADAFSPSLMDKKETPSLLHLLS